MSQQLFQTTPFGLNDLLGEPRKAALLLHSMRPRDQRWILDQLDPEQRLILQDLLAELQDLGIPVEPSLLDNLVNQPPSQPSLTRPSTGTPPIELDHADPTRLIQALGREPAGLIARLLDLEDWRWSKAFLDGLEHSKRRDVESRRRPQGRTFGSPGDGHALRHLLIARLGGRLPLNPPAVRSEIPSPGLPAFAVGRLRSLWRRLGSRAHRTPKVQP